MGSGNRKRKRIVPIKSGDFQGDKFLNRFIPFTPHEPKMPDTIGRGKLLLNETVFEDMRKTAIRRFYCKKSTLSKFSGEIKTSIVELRKNFKELEKAFPQNTRKSGLYLPYEKAKEVYERQQIPRHFLGENEILIFQDGSKYAISNQWGKGNIERFINRAREIGIEILES